MRRFLLRLYLYGLGHAIIFGSPALKLGFVPIDMKAIGLQS